MEWLKRLTVDARRDERTIKSALSALSRASSSKTGFIGKFPFIATAEVYRLVLGAF
jgi:hypothetical protein